MTSTRLGGLLLALGAIVLLASALADPIGLGSEGSDVGWKQITGVVIGALVLAVGAAVLLRGRRSGGGESQEGSA